MMFRGIVIGLVAAVLLFAASAAHAREGVYINPAPVPSRPAADEEPLHLTPFERGQRMGMGIMKMGACIVAVVWFIRSRSRD